MAVQESVSPSRPARPVGIHGTRPNASRRAAFATGASPLLAVCGLCGGAGTTTLSYLIARFAVGEARGHVLVCEPDGPAVGLAGCAGIESPWSLVEAATRVARGWPMPGGPYAVDERAGSPGHELRVIATGPRLVDVSGDERL